MTTPHTPQRYLSSSRLRADLERAIEDPRATGTVHQLQSKLHEELSTLNRALIPGQDHLVQIDALEAAGHLREAFWTGMQIGYTKAEIRTALLLSVFNPAVNR